MNGTFPSTALSAKLRLSEDGNLCKNSKIILEDKQNLSQAIQTNFCLAGDYDTKKLRLTHESKHSLPLAHYRILNFLQ